MVTQEDEKELARKYNVVSISDNLNIMTILFYNIVNSRWSRFILFS